MKKHIRNKNKQKLPIKWAAFAVLLILAVFCMAFAGARISAPINTLESLVNKESAPAELTALNKNPATDDGIYYGGQQAAAAAKSAPLYLNKITAFTADADNKAANDIAASNASARENSPAAKNGAALSKFREYNSSGKKDLNGKARIFPQNGGDYKETAKGVLATNPNKNYFTNSAQEQEPSVSNSGGSIYYGVQSRQKKAERRAEAIRQAKANKNNLPGMEEGAYSAFTRNIRKAFTEKSPGNDSIRKIEKAALNRVKNKHFSNFFGTGAGVRAPGSESGGYELGALPKGGETLVQHLTALPRGMRPNSNTKKPFTLEEMPPVEEPAQEEEEEEPEGPKIISLAPSATETLFALGVGRDIIGVSEYCDYPPKALSIPNMGNSFELKTDKILEAKPDIVFVMRGQNIKGAVNLLRKEEIRVVELDDPANLAQIINNINIIAGAVNADASAVNNALISGFLKARGPVNSMPKVFIDLGGFFTAADSSFVGFLLKESGAQNIFGGMQADYPMVSWGAVVKANPDIIIALSPYSGDFTKMPNSGKVNAVKEKKIFYPSDNEINIINRAGPRSPIAVRILYNYIHAGKGLL